MSAAFVLLLLQGVEPDAAGAQALRARVDAAPGPRVEFQFATRSGVCGDGQSYVHVSGDGTQMFYGTYDDVSQNPCVHGPARIVLDRVSGEIVSLRTRVGPPAATDDGSTNLGMVSASDASAYLLWLAQTAQGAVARDAIMPAMLADSVDNTRTLTALAQDHARPREIRQSAIGWLADNTSNASVVATLVGIATDASDRRALRQSALNALARLDAGAGIPALIKLSGQSPADWTVNTALSALAQSGDPRAHDALRAVITKADLPDQTLAAAVRGFGGRYASAADIELIRNTWPKFVGSRTQDAAISAVAEFGGPDNVAWLLARGGDMGTTSEVRRRALQAAPRAGATSRDLTTLYSRITDGDTKSAIIGALGQIDDQAAVDELLAIAKTDASSSARRRAISVLSDSSDPRVQKALAGIVVGS